MYQRPVGNSPDGLGAVQAFSGSPDGLGSMAALNRTILMGAAVVIGGGYLIAKYSGAKRPLLWAAGVPVGLIAAAKFA
jgi:hypothetical protein